MNWTETLTQDDAKALVALLSEHFNVRRPGIKFTGRQQWRGVYQVGTKIIRVAPKTMPWVVAHEFAHYLDHIDNGRVRGRMENSNEYHSQGFYYKLRKIVLLLGPGYPWQREYRQIARWAAKDPAITDEHYFNISRGPSGEQVG
jgi:hypothetical protein